MRLSPGLALVLVLPACEGGADEVVLPEPGTVEPAAAPVEPSVSTPRKAPPITDCPQILDSPESGDRVIGSACGRVTVKKGYRVETGSLTIEAGVTLAFEPGAEMTVGYQKPGQLFVKGTRDKPVLFTSTELKAIGAWRGLYLYEHADGSEIAGLHLEFGGEGIRGPVYVLADDVKIDDSVIRDTLDVPVHVSQKGRLISFSGNRLERVSSPAMLLPPSSVPAVAADNVFPEGSVIHVLKGVVRERVRWANPGIPFVIGGLLEVAGEDDDVEALLELTPGTTLRFDEDAYINVGYYRPGALRAEGTAEAPIVFTAMERKQSGAWRGVNLYKNATASFAHATFEYGGRRVDSGVLFANSRAALSVADCKFLNNHGGVVLEGGDLRISEFARNTFEASIPSLQASAQAFGALGEGNVFPPDAQLRIEGGRIERDARWRDPGQAIEVTSPIWVQSEATLTIDAGVDLRVRDGFTLAIGEVYGGSVRIEGTAEAPVTIFGIHDRRGTWDAVRLHPRSTGNVIQHLRLRNAGGEAAVSVLGEADLKVEHLSCARCYSPALTWTCGARVVATEVSFQDGSPAGLSAPSGCGS